MSWQKADSWKNADRWEDEDLWEDEDPSNDEALWGDEDRCGGGNLSKDDWQVKKGCLDWFMLQQRVAKLSEYLARKSSDKCQRPGHWSENPPNDGVPEEPDWDPQPVQPKGPPPDRLFAKSQKKEKVLPVIRKEIAKYCFLDLRSPSMQKSQVYKRLKTMPKRSLRIDPEL